MGSTGSPRNTALEELKELLAFLKSLYGILAGVTVLFPFSNQFAGALPLPYGYEGLGTTLATVFSLFLVLGLFVSRNHFGRMKDPRLLRKIGGPARIGAFAMMYGSALLLFYLYQDPRGGVARPWLAFAYSGIFALFTVAFTGLSMQAWLDGRPGVRDRAAEGSLEAEVSYQVAIDRALLTLARDLPEDRKSVALRKSIPGEWRGRDAIRLWLNVEYRDAHREIHTVWIDVDGHVLQYEDNAKSPHTRNRLADYVEYERR